MQLSIGELRELLAALNQTDVAELTLKSADFELTVRKGGALGIAAEASGSEVTHLQPPQIVTAAAPPADVVPPKVVTPSAPPPTNSKLIDVTSPIVGTFYRAPAPEEPPFVDVGDRIKVGQTVCIIEAMKIMNDLEAEVSGQIVEILVNNGEPVEYGQTLMRVDPG